LKDDFAAVLSADIKNSQLKVVRIHSAGDFYSNKYILDWVKIVRSNPDVAFYAYTRSWRLPGLLPDLEKLRRLPNMQLWWSTDAETGEAPEGISAYLALDDNDMPIEGTSLVLRNKRSTVMKKMGGCQVCPLESGRPELKLKLTCYKCRVCFSNALTGIKSMSSAVNS